MPGMQLNEAVAQAGPQIRELHASLARRTGLYQHQLLDANRLAKRCQFSVSSLPFDEELVLSLWAHGLIPAENRADPRKWIEAGDSEPTWPGILDFKKPTRGVHGPRFHLYRLYSLWRIYRTARAPLHPIRFSRRNPGDAVDPPLHYEHIDGDRSFVHDRTFLEQINLIATLAMVCEPSTFTRITGRVVPMSGLDFDAARKRRDRHREQIEPHLRFIGMDALETIRTELCRAAQQIEPNVQAHKLMRLCDHDFQINLKGCLFVAVLFNQMAEAIRRETESAFDICLPEEDLCGYLQWNKRARTRIFGTGRPLNAPPRVWKAFLRHLDIDPGIKARVYVEGSTEAGAFEHLLGGFPHVEIIDLAGRVHQKGSPAFEQSLKNDIHKQIFSFVVLDSDREDNLRAIRKAASQDDFFGEVCIFQPDFDRSAVSDDRKIRAVLSIAKAGGGSATELEQIATEVDFSEGFETLQNHLRLRFSCLRDFKKGPSWGRALAETVIETPFPTKAEELRKEKNPLLKARGRILMSARYDYTESRRASRVCTTTLQLVPRG